MVRDTILIAFKSHHKKQKGEVLLPLFVPEFLSPLYAFSLGLFLSGITLLIGIRSDYDCVVVILIFACFLHQIIHIYMKLSCISVNKENPELFSIYFTASFFCLRNYCTFHCNNSELCLAALPSLLKVHLI